MYSSGIRRFCHGFFRHELTGASYITQLPKGKHSTKGVGRTAPDPAGGYTTPDGTLIPMGKGVNNFHQTSSLLYNEYPLHTIQTVTGKNNCLVYNFVLDAIVFYFYLYLYRGKKGGGCLEASIFPPPLLPPTHTILPFSCRLSSKCVNILWILFWQGTAESLNTDYKPDIYLQL